MQSRPIISPSCSWFLSVWTSSSVAHFYDDGKSHVVVVCPGGENLSGALCLPTKTRRRVTWLSFTLFRYFFATRLLLRKVNFLCISALFYRLFRV